MDYNFTNQNMNNYNNYEPKKKKDHYFAKSVLVPFCSSIVGTCLVLGIVFNVPMIQNKLLSTSSTNNNSSASNPNINTTQVSLSNFSDTGVSVAQKVLPSVVGIEIQYPLSSVFSRTTSTVSASGSGIIISSDGYILTNNHVVSSSSESSYYSIGEATSIKVYLYDDETGYDAEIIGTDSQTDLAVVKINKENLTAATLGDSDALQVGEWCMAIGNPLGMQSSVTTGSISALNRQLTDSEGTNYTLIQTDTAINSGNSGGALVNSKGEVIGINTLKASGTGIEGMCFAIPINSTKTIYSDLITYNKVKRPYIGITTRNITEQTIKANPTIDLKIGVYIKSIENYSPAEKADLKIGDIILKVNDTEVSSLTELNSEIYKYKIGDTITLTIYRDGKEKDVSLTLAEEP